MWHDLYIKQRHRYRDVIMAYANLGKSFQPQDVNSLINVTLAKVAFKRHFVGMDFGIQNTAYDMYINHSDNKDAKKYLVAVKKQTAIGEYLPINSFHLLSQNDWRTFDVNDSSQWLPLAKAVSEAWNTRLHSYCGNLKGYKKDQVRVEAVYHTLRANDNEIKVGEIGFPTIKIAEIHDIKMLYNESIQFADDQHRFQYEIKTGILKLQFNESEVTGTQWPYQKIDSPLSAIDTISEKMATKNDSPIESHSWYLDVKPYSGFNTFYGKSKLSRAPGYRENRIQKFIDDFKLLTDDNLLKWVKSKLDQILLEDWKSDDGKQQMVNLRSELMNRIIKTGNIDLKNAVAKMVYRPASEIQFLIPNSKEFHRLYPHFFVDDIIYKFSQDRDARTFNLRFMPSEDEVKAYIGQDTGKAINFLNDHEAIGNWILKDVFQLQEYEPLTEKRLRELKINGVRFIKRANQVDLEFIWIDKQHEPKDIWHPYYQVESLF